jgi:hypothetical protein
MMLFPNRVTMGVMASIHEFLRIGRAKAIQYIIVTKSNCGVIEVVVGKK